MHPLFVVYNHVPMAAEQARRERFIAYAETLGKRFQTGILANMQEKPLRYYGNLRQTSKALFINGHLPQEIIQQACISPVSGLALIRC